MYSYANCKEKVRENERKMMEGEDSLVMDNTENTEGLNQPLCVPAKSGKEKGFSFLVQNVVEVRCAPYHGADKFY